MNLLVTGAFGCSDSEIKALTDLGYTVYFLQNEKEALPCSYSEIDAVICNGLFLHHPIEKFTSLKLIQLTSAGFDRVPMEYVEEKGIAIYNARGVYSVPMAEYAVCGVLSIYKQMQFFNKNQTEHKWEKHRFLKELYGKTVCIVGCGSVGNECAKLFSAFGCEIIGVDKYTRQDKLYNEILPIENLNKALAKSDIVVLTLPLTKETKHLFDENIFEFLKAGAVLVNISRGAVVETNALLSALENKLCGAVLDVFEEEPLSDNSPLWKMENVIITPHNSFVGEGNHKRLWEVIKSNLEKNK